MLNIYWFISLKIICFSNVLKLRHNFYVSWTFQEKVVILLISQNLPVLLYTIDFFYTLLIWSSGMPWKCVLIFTRMPWKCVLIFTIFIFFYLKYHLNTTSKNWSLLFSYFEILSLHIFLLNLIICVLLISSLSQRDLLYYLLVV